MADNTDIKYLPRTFILPFFPQMNSKVFFVRFLFVLLGCCCFKCLSGIHSNFKNK